MSARPACVYRLLVTYPEGSLEPGWEPACWKNQARPDARDLLTSRKARKYRRWQRDRTFRWPRNHLYLSSSGAYERAALLRSYGAGGGHSRTREGMERRPARDRRRRILGDR